VREGGHRGIDPAWRGLAVAAALGLAAAPAAAQSPSPSRGPSGEVSFFTSASRLAGSDPGANLNSSEFITTMTIGMKEGTGSGWDYALDLRHAGSTTPGRDPRVSIYDAFIGQRLRRGTVLVRAGQMWIPDLGGLGAVAGGLGEYRFGWAAPGLGRLRAGGFGGAEPVSYALGYVNGVRKFGGYAIFDAAHGRKLVAGYVHVAHGGLTERSVLSVTNFVPVRARLFAYQSAEYDLVGPAGQGRGGLTYLLVNVRATATKRVDVQGTYHRGRSIDTRAIADDVLNGRPIPAGATDGLLYESLGGRTTVSIARRTRVFAGYARDRTNYDSAATGRLTFGGSATSLAGSGADLTVSASRIKRPTGQFNAIFASVGRQIGSPVYLSADYSSSLSIVQFTRSNGLTVEMRPRTHQVGGSAVILLRRHLSMLVTAERTTGGSTSDVRVMAGLTYRFRP
jgi:hypothetical protein